MGCYANVGFSKNQHAATTLLTDKKEEAWCTETVGRFRNLPLYALPPTKGHVGAYFNAACVGDRPSCKWVNMTNKKQRFIKVRAARKIAKGEALTVSYRIGGAVREAQVGHRYGGGTVSRRAFLLARKPNHRSKSKGRFVSTTK
jgi:hypothetical protein